MASKGQEQGGWSRPYQLSIGNVKSWSNITIADQYGFVHAFWVEVDLSVGREIIQYARFDGQSWSSPMDIFVTRSDHPFGEISSVVDQHGVMHLIWSGGTDRGPIYYTHAPINNAASAQAWSHPLILNIPADAVSLQIDSKDVIHILYTRYYEQPGVYYIKSENKGAIWSEPIWLDPDIPPDHVPNSTYIDLVLDDDGGLHTVWYYRSTIEATGDWVRYAHSLDGGDSWSMPYTIDISNVETGHEMTFAGPNLVAQDHIVHIVWAAGEFSYRHHRLSTDSGKTWSAPNRILGELNGQAKEDLVIDSIGRVHFLGQIRYPQAVWYAYWYNDRWSIPSMVYLYARSFDDPARENRIHVHSIHSTILNGNQLVMTFTDPPGQPEISVYAMHYMLDDLPPSKPLPTPMPATLVPSQTPTHIPTQTPLASSPSIIESGHPKAASSVIDPSSPSYSIWMGLLPALVLLGSVVAFQMLRKR